jgi:hypothetical protein
LAHDVSDVVIRRPLNPLACVPVTWLSGLAPVPPRGDVRQDTVTHAEIVQGEIVVLDEFLAEIAEGCW